MKNLRGIRNFLAMAPILMLLTGCIPLIIGVAAGAGGVAYVRGILEQNIDQDLSRSHEAVISAFKDLKISIKTDEVNKHNTKTVGKSEDKKDVTVALDALTEKATKVQIRVGLFGDEESSLKILNAIQKHL